MRFFIKEGIFQVLNNNYFMVCLFLGFLFIKNLGFYSKRPQPDFEGSTSIVVRAWNEPFFNSQERFCIMSEDEENSVCTEVAAAYREKYSVLVDLPWWEFAHRKSIDNIPQKRLSSL